MRHHIFTVRHKHWWHWLSPTFREHRRALQAWIDSREAEIMETYRQQYMDLLMYGCSILPFDALQDTINKI